MNLITGYAGEAHVTSREDAIRNAFAMANGGKYVVPNFGGGLAATKLSNTSVRIADGVAINQGRVFTNDSTEDLTISAGTAGSYRNDIIVARYEKDTQTNIETVTLTVVEGTSGATATDPTIYDNELLESESSVDDVALYRVKLNGTTIEEIEPIYKSWYLDTGWIENALEEISVSYYQGSAQKPIIRVIGNRVFLNACINVTEDFEFKIPDEYLPSEDIFETLYQKRSTTDAYTRINCLKNGTIESVTNGTIGTYMIIPISVTWFLD